MAANTKKQKYMKRNIMVFAAVCMATASGLAAPKDQVDAAVRKLIDGGNYSWSITVTNLLPIDKEIPVRDRRFLRGPGPSWGKIIKEGYMLITRVAYRGTNTQTLVKGQKCVIKDQDGSWKTPKEMPMGLGARGGIAEVNQPPTVDALNLLEAVREFNVANTALSGKLRTEAMSNRSNPFSGKVSDALNAESPQLDNAKGNVKFWVKDGVLEKIEHNLQGTISLEGKAIPINRTTIVEFKDIGNTTFVVPEEARKKLD